MRSGYRQLHVLLCREGWPVNHKRIYRLYREVHIPGRSIIESLERVIGFSWGIGDRLQPESASSTSLASTINT